MKSKVVYLAAISAAAFVLSNTNAQAEQEVLTPPTLAKNDLGFYAKADAGAAFQQNLKLEHVETSFNPGFRGDLSFGYNFNPALAVEVEGGYLWNSFDTFGGMHLPTGVEGDLYQYPFLAKAILKIPYENGLTPYFGAGVGGVGSTLHLKDSTIDENPSDFSFAFAAEAGLRYAITENIEVNFGYKFLGTTGYRYNTSFAPLRTDNTYSHSALVSFIWNF